MAITDPKCCPRCLHVAVNKNYVANYTAWAQCTKIVPCPLACIWDRRVAVCDSTQSPKQCVMMMPNQIECGAVRTAEVHDCPDGWLCTHDNPQGQYQTPEDHPGHCREMKPCVKSPNGNMGCESPFESCIDDPTDNCKPGSRAAAKCPRKCILNDINTIKGPMCGGIAGIPCEGGTCWDDPRDNCDPDFGGADCSGVCVVDPPDPCELVRCRAGTHCKVCRGQAKCILNGKTCRAFGG